MGADALGSCAQRLRRQIERRREAGQDLDEAWRQAAVRELMDAHRLRRAQADDFIGQLLSRTAGEGSPP